MPSPFTMGDEKGLDSRSRTSHNGNLSRTFAVDMADSLTNTGIEGSAIPIAHRRSGGDAWICPRMVEVCRPKDAPGGTVQFQSYTTNYGGPLRKSDLMRTESRMQLYATILAGVCYRLYGDIRGAHHQDNNVKHYLKDL